MKMIMSAALLAIGVALFAPAGASAAPMSGLDPAAKNASLVEPAAWACRRIRVCRGGYYHHRRCTWRRVCRHWY